MHSKDDLIAGQQCKITVKLSRDVDEDEGMVVEPVYAPKFPKEKEESWWVLLGDTSNNSLLAIKRLSFTKPQMSVNLLFELGDEVGQRKFTLYLMCDAYQGVDQEHAVKLKVGDGL